ncbi:UDP-glucose 4-epimerase GalE [Frankia sp. CNm7]|uniref:UDP-glucose 4-epimerase n=1 Tax=Frankia nepalensis TaxID=1836974 RepID=A0A937RDH7_9ACTN|nr:UDP-glucose 4-epimerase GalE [Frankia nepalensis]MBL7501400.1 UDP-glucose 4-epimerase GalE [Frankia nepalensis]MBL7511927.1 UDP-glucose 4-epimerase GalE [Frankia nepalensis]MBL7523432.1 UDP-glucose 4-epimerase GalE [Frankia nepalensis]MBL7628252.1 UDP-glucose 4-epimerase GalE [Frankia nepalensis]
MLVTGAAGFIGSHTCVDLLTAGYRVVGVDNFVNSSPRAVERIREVAGPAGANLEFVELDVRDSAALSKLLAVTPVAAVVHFAALKAVGESVALPVEYYDTNLNATLRLVDALREHGPRRLIFSSSCSIHGDVDVLPIREDAPSRPTNPYSRTKAMCEQILADLCVAEPDWHVVALRYFNPVGAHPSGLLGEDPRGTPNNLMPYLQQVAVGRREFLTVFGDDYPTPDGTGVRDYIHVVDLAEGHRAALEHLADAAGFRAINLGTGVGTSVRQLLEAFGAACGHELPYRVAGRRAGDVAELYADPSHAAETIGWRASRGLAEMCRDAWEFQRHNPGGYDGAGA